jgi:hypothetical protein
MKFSQATLDVYMIRVDNKGAMATRLMMPVLGIGGEKSFGSNEAVVMRNAANNVTELVFQMLGIADGRSARRDHPSDPILHC